MQVVTVASDINNSGFVNYLKPSCEYYKLDFLVLEYDDTFFSNRLKDALLHEYLKDVSDEELIFFTDATDAAFLADEKEILRKFHTFNSPLVFSAEVNCWPDSAMQDTYPAISTHFRYLNSGGFMGKAGFIKEIYNKYPIFDPVFDSEFNWSNQYYWHHVFIKESSNIKLDHHCELFYNTAIWYDNINDFRTRLRSSNEKQVMYQAEKLRLDNEIIFANGRIKSNITQTLPCHIHFPGPISKMLMEEGYFQAIIHSISL
jgi:hypothetical protein